MCLITLLLLLLFMLFGPKRWLHTLMTLRAPMRAAERFGNERKNGKRAALLTELNAVVLM